MSVPTHFRLNTGAEIPVVGLGTWKAEPGEVRGAVAFALRYGYRHIDTALIYGNENEVGQGMKDSGVPRKEIFITGKLWNTHHPNAEEGLQQTLDALGTDYLDLYLIHWPVRLVPNETSQLLPTNPDGSRSVDRSWDQGETWLQMEDLYRSGKTVTPAVNQVELHPYLPQHELRRYCEKLGILLEAYSPLGSTGAPIMADPEIQAIADKHNASAATVLISHHACRGVVALPKSVSKKRISDNRKIVVLSPDELAVLDGLAAKGKAKRINTPAWGFDLGFADWYGPV